jgi:hypothetical protein
MSLPWRLLSILLKKETGPGIDLLEEALVKALKRV